MSEAGTAVLNRPEQKESAPDSGQKRVTELRVSGHLMTLEAGLFCVFQAPGSSIGGDPSGLPGVRISLPPGPAGNPDAVSISTFRADGWLSGRDAAALVRVSEGPAQVLVTVYQSPNHAAETAPRLQVLRLSQEPAAAEPAHPGPDDIDAEAASAIVLHRQRTGDVIGRVGDWLGERGSKLWVEGFSINPPAGVAPEDLEYQAVLGRGWNSPWVEGGTFCGSRGMALPLLGLRLRLKGRAAETHALRYTASFVDGTEIGPVGSGDACEAESLAALEAIHIELLPRAGSRNQPTIAKAGAATRKLAARPAHPAPVVRRAR
jgi:hypothetical protein